MTVADNLIRVLIIDDHAIVRAGLRMLLAAHQGLRVVAEASSQDEAIRLSREEQPHIILLDVDLGTENGLDFLPELFEAAPAVRVILLTGLMDTELHRRGVRLGAMGLVLKDQAVEVLITAITKVHAGEAWIDRSLTASVLTELARSREVGNADPEARRIASLTEREREVVTLLCEGLKNRHIAERLVISETTVRHHLTSIFSKLGVTDRLELMIYAYRHSLGKPPE